MDMLSQKEWIFYAVVGAAVLLNEMAALYGIAICTFLPLMGCVLVVGFWAFPTREKNTGQEP